MKPLKLIYAYEDKTNAAFNIKWKNIKKGNIEQNKSITIYSISSTPLYISATILLYFLKGQHYRNIFSEE